MMRRRLCPRTPVCDVSGLNIKPGNDEPDAASSSAFRLVEAELDTTERVALRDRGRRRPGCYGARRRDSWWQAETTGVRGHDIVSLME
jgi:hypothetical protein